MGKGTCDYRCLPATTPQGSLKFLRKTIKRHGRAHIFVTDKLGSYGAAMKMIGNVDKQEAGRWLNNRAENSHQSFRRRERAMLRFRRMLTLQKFVAVHASVHNHFNAERHLYSRDNFKLNRAIALDVALLESILPAGFRPVSSDTGHLFPL
jgi:putative transposase